MKTYNGNIIDAFDVDVSTGEGTFPHLAPFGTEMVPSHPFNAGRDLQGLMFALLSFSLF